MMGGGGVNKGSEFYKFRPLGKKKCYCYAKKSGLENIFPEQFRGGTRFQFLPGKIYGGKLSNVKREGSPVGGVFSWLRTDQSSVHPSPY